MPHVAFVPFTGFRIREPELLELGMSLPGLRRRGEAIASLPPLGLLTLAGMTPESWSRSWHEAPTDSEALAAAVLAARPTLVAISALTASVEQAYRFAARIRKAGVPVALGGLHATALPDEVARHVDAVVVGEGEPIWTSLLADAARGGVARRYQAARPFDLAASPLPDFALSAGAARERFTLQTQRGCPLACEFCAASRLLGPFRVKPAARIARELDAIRALDSRPRIELADDNTFAGGRSPGPLLDVLEASGARWFSEVDWRCGEDPSVTSRLAAAGCVQVLVGVESRVHRHRGMGAKDADPARIADAVAAIQDGGVPVNACFIVGADGETPGTLAALADELLAAPYADIQLTLQTPFPGTALRRRLERAGRLLDRSWASHTLFDVTYQPDAMTVEDLERGFRELLSRVFSPAASARRDSIRRTVMRRRPA